MRGGDSLEAPDGGLGQPEGSPEGCEHLCGQDNDDTDACKENLGTNGKAGSRWHESNWHGQLISNVAKHFEGETFTQPGRAW